MVRAKRTPARRAKKVDVINDTVEPEVQKTSPEDAKMKPRTFVIPLVVGIVVGVAVMNGISNLQPAAIVNGQPISKQEIYKDLMKQGGDKILDNKITETLIMQEAKKKNIEASDKEINARIDSIDKDITAKGQNIDTLLKSQGQTRQDLKDQLKIQILVEKLLGNQVAVTEQEAKDYFDKNKEAYGEDATYESKAVEIKDGLKNQKLSEKFQEWLTKVKGQAKISNFLTK
jgi:foldase protein PrsA